MRDPYSSIVIQGSSNSFDQVFIKPRAPLALCTMYEMWSANWVQTKHQDRILELFYLISRHSARMSFIED